MKHVKALAIKLVSLFIILWAILGGMYGLSAGDILTITVVFGLIEYVIGDMIVLRYTNNAVGTIGDFGLALLIIWSMARNMTTLDNVFSAALFASIGVTIFEYFFHKYVIRNVFEHEPRGRQETPKRYRYQTETSVELSDLNRKID